MTGSGLDHLGAGRRVARSDPQARLPPQHHPEALGEEALGVGHEHGDVGHQREGKGARHTGALMGTTIVIADGQRLFAESLAGALDLQPDLDVIDHAARTGLDAVDAFLRLRPNVLALDYWLAEMNGAAATRVILERHPTARVLLLGWLYGPLQVREARQAGAAALVPKSLSLEDIVTVVRSVADGFSVFPGRTPASPLEWAPAAEVHDAPYLGLSPREIEVLQLFCEGRRRNEVAAELGIREGTVKNHVHNILTKTGARTLVEAVTLARDEGLVREGGLRPKPGRQG